MYEHLVHIYEGVADRMPVPTQFYGWTDETFLDLTWLPAQSFSYEIQNSRWLPQDIIPQPLERHFKYGAEIYDIDEDLKVVHVTREILPMTPEEAAQQDADTVAGRKQQARYYRQNREWQGYTYQGQLMSIDSDSRLRLIELGMVAAADPDFAGFYPSPTDPWFELGQASAIALSQSAALFLWACLQREHDIVEAIEAWTFTDDMLNEGWPL